MIPIPWTIKNADFILREFTLEDIDEFHLNALNNTQHMRYSRQANIYHCVETTLEYISELKEVGGVILGIFDIDEKFRLGTVTMTPTGRAISFGFLIYPEFAGKGILSNVLPFLLSELDYKEGVEWLHIGTHKDNLSMKRVALKQGFKVLDYETLRAIFGLSFQNPRDELVHLIKPTLRKNNYWQE
jgi:RimJ/RimL family protein N-acetyltransferase